MRWLVDSGNTNHYRDSRQSDLDSFCERCSWVNTRAGASAAMPARLLIQSYSCCGGMIDRCASQSQDSPRQRDAAASHSREVFIELCRFPSSHASSSSHEAAKYVLKVLVWSIRISTINICIMLASQIPERARGLWGLPGNHNNITPPPDPGPGRWGINHFYSADEFRHFEFVWYLENWIVFLNLQP